jgi:hypothetical protein
MRVAEAARHFAGWVNRALDNALSLSCSSTASPLRLGDRKGSQPSALRQMTGILGVAGTPLTSRRASFGN